MKLLGEAFSEIIEKKIFPDAAVRGGPSGINAVYSRQEVADGVISGYNVETFLDYLAANL